MARNYINPFLSFCIIISVTTFSHYSHAQEVKIFSLEDFDLNGKVKTCLVVTNYGKEEFEFNEDGLLTKLITRYNETDYEKTYYKYANSELLEKRLESYRDGVFDKNTSIANIYTIDTTSGRKITEKIISYTKEFLDQYEYIYNESGDITTIKRTNDSGIDETKVTYTSYRGESTITYFLNGVIHRSIRTSKNKAKQRVVLTKEFIEGLPNKALEEIYDTNEKIVSEIHFVYETEAEEFASKKVVSYSYNEAGMLSEMKSKTEDEEEMVKNYIYQYDDGDKGNWIKKIITPDNTYTTRKIEYYVPEVSEEETEKE